MKHYAFILSSLLWAESIWADTTEKPNVLFIICDDLNDYVTGFGDIRRRRRHTSRA